MRFSLASDSKCGKQASNTTDHLVDKGLGEMVLNHYLKDMRTAWCHLLVISGTTPHWFVNSKEMLTFQGLGL